MAVAVIRAQPREHTNCQFGTMLSSCQWPEESKRYKSLTVGSSRMKQWCTRNAPNPSAWRSKSYVCMDLRNGMELAVAAACDDIEFASSVVDGRPREVDAAADPHTFASLMA